MNAHSPVPSGVLALVGEAVRRQRDAEQRGLEVLTAAGFQQVLLPVLEFDEGSRAGGYRFVDGTGRLVALRTDFTPLAGRLLAPCLSGGTLPLHVCYAGEVVRPRPASLRQLPELYQLGFESYGVRSGAPASLELTFSLARAVGVDLGRCHLTVGVAGLAEQILAQLLEEPAEEDLVELMQVRDLDALADALGVQGARLGALAGALFAAPPETWAEALGVDEGVVAVRPLLERAAGNGVPASLDVAPRLAGSYYRGCVFSLWGEASRAVIAAGGEYEVALATGPLPAVGACLALGIALEEAGEREEGRGERTE